MQPSQESPQEQQTPYNNYNPMPVAQNSINNNECTPAPQDEVIYQGNTRAVVDNNAPGLITKLARSVCMIFTSGSITTNGYQAVFNGTTCQTKIRNMFNAAIGGMYQYSYDQNFPFWNLNAPGGGTGFLITPRHVLTNAHVYEGIKNQQSYMLFNCQNADTNRVYTINSDFYTYNQAMVMSATEYKDILSYSKMTVDMYCDMCILTLSREVPSTVATPVQLAEYISEYRQMPLFTMGHPKGMQLIYAREGYSKLYEKTSKLLKYTLATLPGASGSPIFNNNGQVVALNQAMIVQNVQVNGQPIITLESFSLDLSDPQNPNKIFEKQADGSQQNKGDFSAGTLTYQFSIFLRPGIGVFCEVQPFRRVHSDDQEEVLHLVFSFQTGGQQTSQTFVLEYNKSTDKYDVKGRLDYAFLKYTDIKIVSNNLGFAKPCNVILQLEKDSPSTSSILMSKWVLFQGELNIQILQDAYIYNTQTKKVLELRKI